MSPRRLSRAKPTPAQPSHRISQPPSAFRCVATHNPHTHSQPLCPGAGLPVRSTYIHQGRIKRMPNRCSIRPSNQSRPLPRCCGIPLRPKGSFTITNATSTTPWGSQPEPAQPSTFPQPQVYGYQDSKSITRQIICDLRLHLLVGPDVGFPEAPIAFIASHTLH